MIRPPLARLILSIALLTVLAPALPAAAAPDWRCFVETGQCVAGAFLTYWDAHGGLARNGYPLTPERRELLEDGREYTVQYFERVRMEYHPENAAPYDVLLGQFGRQVLAWRDMPIAPPLAALYRGDPGLRELLGPPRPITGPTDGTTDVLTFERGLLLITNGGKTNPQSYGISAFCPSLDAGPYGVNPRTFLPDGGTIIVTSFTQLPAGGPGPRPGTYAPGGVAGLAWEQVGRECLGYATAAAPTAQPIVGQTFGRGVLLALPDRGEAYALYRREVDSGTKGYYRRYTLPK